MILIGARLVTCRIEDNFCLLVTSVRRVDAAIRASPSTHVRYSFNIKESVINEKKCFNRRTLEGPLDVHPSKNAIVVHYVVEAYITTEYGEPIVADRKECKKMYVNAITLCTTQSLDICRVNVSGLTAASNVTTIAKQLIAQCSLIQPSRLPELEQLLMYLQKRKLEKKGDCKTMKYPVMYNYLFSIDTQSFSNGLGNTQPLPTDVSVHIL